MTRNFPVRIGVQLAPQHASFATHMAAVQEVEQLGADAVFNWDHFFPLSGNPDGAHFEATTQLAAWAAVTSTIELGPLVFCNSYRNPDLLADIARTLDHASDGRFIFGIGSGWFERDYEEYGYTFGTAGGRLNKLAAALPRIRERWTKLNPAPVRDIPILIGGAGEKKTLRLVAEHANIWHSFVGPDVLPHKLEVLQEHCEAVGRNLDEIEFSNGASVRAGADAIGEERLDELFELGTTFFTIPLTPDDQTGAYDFAPVRTAIAWRDAKNA
ncbi:LLM class F420-dependent oxidoreductase [Humidisolicoccus flavus]|uniref:LLM class F420-dependent oxidoreductase n=1 Tax=Humidisolicoccus flavus TaxID=3111414 RepID=UPI00324B5B42